MFDLSKSVIMPRDDFEELVTVAYTQTPMSTPERIASTIQTVTVLASMAACFGGCVWTWYKAATKLEDKKLANEITAIEERTKSYQAR